MGIRPEDVWLAEPDEQDALTVQVSSSEPLGSYTIVNAKMNGQLIKIRAPGQVTLTPDSSARVTLDARRIHLFDSRGLRFEPV